MRKNTNAFTFVELIIVLVILAILSTIGFVTYESYLSTGRDTRRIAELKGLHQGLSSFAIKTKLPLPINKVDITSGTTLVSHHGDIDDTIASNINFKGELYDKELDTYPVYVLGKNKKDFQLLNFVEDRGSLLETSIPKIHAFTEYQNLIPIMVGKPLGVFLENETNKPIHRSENYSGNTSYDIISGTGVFDIHMSKDVTIDVSNTGSALQVIPNHSCNRILEMGKSKGSGVYSINPLGGQKIKAYCEMRIDGGGWTLLGRSVQGGSGDFGWLEQQGNVEDDSRAYSFGSGVTNMHFKEIMIASYSGFKKIEYAGIFGVKSSYLSNNFTQQTTPPLDQTSYVTRMDGCKDYIGYKDGCNQGNLSPIFWGKFGHPGFVVSRSNYHEEGLKVGGFQYSGSYPLANSQGMIFIR